MLAAAVWKWTELTGTVVAIFALLKAIDVWIHRQQTARDELERRLSAPASLQVQVDMLRADIERLRDAIRLMGKRASDQLTDIQGNIGKADLRLHEAMQRLSALEAVMSRALEICDRRHPEEPERHPADFIERRHRKD